jgi:NAD(P) transhydrogenase subunit alpha
MLIGIIKETTPDENRVAITPQIVKNLTSVGIQIIIEKNAGINAGFSDDEFLLNGADICDSPQQSCHDCNILFKIWAPSAQECSWLANSPLVIADFRRADNFSCHTFRAFALNKIPRISRAQSMDILSSQNNLAGYKAALSAINSCNRCASMMITSAGTLPPLKILILGLGVAGLQAAATAKHLGAKVYASDIRHETKEHALSVGAFFLDSISNFSDYDIIITCAGTFPNAPILINPTIFNSIPKQTFLLDVSGNIDSSISAPNIHRKYNLPSQIANSASQLFAHNIYNFFCLIYNFPSQNLNLDFNDEIINATYLGER